MNKNLSLLLIPFFITSLVAMESPVGARIETPRETSEEIGSKYIALERLCVAIKSNQMSEVRRLAAQVTDIKFALPDSGNSPLHVALLAPSPNPEIITLLLSRGADQTQQNKFGLTPLENMAAMCRNTKLVEAIENKPEEVANLLADGASPNTSYNSVDVLYIALTKNNFAAAHLLLKHGARATKKYTGNDTVLHAMNPSLKQQKIAITIAQQLIEAGASLDARNDIGETPLDTAKRNMNQELADFFMEYLAKKSEVDASIEHDK